MKTVAAFASLAALVAASASAGPIEKRARLGLTFVPPSSSPLSPSSNYVGANNGSLPKREVVSGKAFDRIIQIWLENTDFEAAMSTPAMQALLPQGVLFDNYYAVTHPSEPNYQAAVTGDFWGLGDDTFNHVRIVLSSTQSFTSMKHSLTSSPFFFLLLDSGEHHDGLRPP